MFKCKWFKTETNFKKEKIRREHEGLIINVFSRPGPDGVVTEFVAVLEKNSNYACGYDTDIITLEADLVRVYPILNA